MKTTRLLSLSVAFLLLVSPFMTMSRPYVTAQTPGATLTGNILDHGADANGNGLYDYLEVDVEVNVTVAGNFMLSTGTLMDQFGNIIPVSNNSQGFLNAGIQYLNVSLFGPTIFSYQLNPEKIYEISLYTENYTWQGIYNVTLSRIYNYTEFDSRAFWTGKVSDRGVDTDGDGLFNYLEVGIEFNVTEAGQYMLDAAGLMEKNGFMMNYLYESHYETKTFSPGIYTFDMNFSGSQIASERINPTHVNYLSIYDLTNIVVLSQLDSAPLSKRYDYTLFNAPSRDIQVNFQVYPNATIAVAGALNYTHMYPENTYYPEMNASVGFSTNGNMTTETSNGTFFFPEDTYKGYNTIEAHSLFTYKNGFENNTITASAILPPEETQFYPYNATDVGLNASYAGGFFDVAINGQTVIPTPAYSAAYSTLFPFNMSDATVRAEFDGTTLQGNITFHVIPGFPLTDVTVYFSGNRSSLNLMGNVNVTYSNYGDFQVNQTTLDQKLADLSANFTGGGPSSLYNESGGCLECTNLNVTKTPWSGSTLGADVMYSATVVGNFTGALARMMFPAGSPDDQVQQFAYASLESAGSSVKNASLVLSYYHETGLAQIDLHLTCDVQGLCSSLLLLAPPAIPSYWSSEEKQIEALFKVANATSYALTGAGVKASYSSAERKTTLDAWLMGNDRQLKNDLIPVLPDLVPPNMHDLIASYFNTTYGTVNSSVTTFDMVNGTATFASQVNLQGDFEAELNRGKALLIASFNATLPSSSLPTWELNVLNETDININNFEAELQIGRDWMYANFSGLILKPQPDDISAITFRLKNWLNMTSSLNAPPQDFDRFSITITGASSENQTVLLSQQPNLPSPDELSPDGRSMVWNNASLSSLQDVTFLIAYQSRINYAGGSYDVPIFTNSTVTAFVFDPNAKQIVFNVTGPPGTGFSNVTIPKALLNASALSDWTVTFDGQNLTPHQFDITQNAEYVFVYLNYTHSAHVIAIRGTQLVPEFQPDILPVALAILLIIVAIVAVRQRRKLEPVKTRFLQTVARLRSAQKTN